MAASSQLLPMSQVGMFWNPGQPRRPIVPLNGMIYLERG